MNKDNALCADECEYLKCPRNKANVSDAPGLIVYAPLKGTAYCDFYPGRKVYEYDNRTC